MSGKYPEGATKQEKGVIRKRAKHFRTRDGQLFRVCKNRNKEEEHLCLVIRDQKVRRQIFEGCRVGPAGNHEGRDRTQAKIQEKYYWPGITKHVKQWHTQCQPPTTAGNKLVLISLGHMHVYRTSVQGSTGFIPFFLMHFREAKLPIHVKVEEVTGEHGCTGARRCATQPIKLSVHVLHVCSPDICTIYALCAPP